MNVCVCVFSWRAFVCEYRSLSSRATSESGGADSFLCGRLLLSFLHFIKQSLLLHHVRLLISLGSLCLAAILKASVSMSACLPACATCCIRRANTHSSSSCNKRFNPSNISPGLRLKTGPDHEQISSPFYLLICPSRLFGKVLASASVLANPEHPTWILLPVL